MLLMRPYQEQALDNLFQYIETHGTAKKPLVVAATGAGKSVLIAKLCEKATSIWPEARIVMLTHVKELVQQNYSKMRMLLPPQKIGVYCAGLKRKQPGYPIVCGSIQSVHRSAGRLGTRHIIIIDEVHLMKSADEGMYRSFINQYPDAIIIGFTATPYRTDSGEIAGKGKFFDDVVANVSILDLLKQGYLCPLVAVDSELAYETSNVKIVNGDFSQKELEQMAMDIEKTKKAIAEILARGANRRKWLIFCVSIKHAEFISAILNENGIQCQAIHQKTPDAQRASILRNYTHGDLRAITNVGVLTTGFDAPNIDMIVLLRPTQSAVLYVQMLGRGMRISETKEDCLVLDYGENVMRHGPVTHIKPPKKGGRIKVNREFGDDEALPKASVCQDCRTINLPEAESCYICGQDIIKNYRKINHTDKASRHSLISWEDGSDYALLDIDSVKAGRHKKEGSPDSVRIEFHAGLNRVTGWICLFHSGYAAAKAKRIWRQLMQNEDYPGNVFEAVNLINEKEFSIQLMVKNSGKYPEILEIRHGNKPNAEIQHTERVATAF